jgi:hypothetical protein
MIATLAVTLAVAQTRATPVEINLTRDRTVAILPIVFRGGTVTAMRTARDTIDRFFDHAGYDEISVRRIRQSFRPYVELVGPEQDGLPRLPSDGEMRRVGQSLGATLVCAAEISWHTRSVWVSLGPKTKSTCTINLKMIDMAHGDQVLSEHDVTADDTAEESGFATAAGIITGGLVTVVSGGPETPHQQRAVQIALSKAFEPWLEGAISR